MANYVFSATNNIAEVFDEHNVKYKVINMNGQEEVLAGFSVENRPVILKFISTDECNDVAARIFGLFCNTPKEKRGRVLEACNIANNKVRFLKFCLDDDGDVNVEFDFPERSDENVGEIALEILIRSMNILESEYKIFAKALYSDAAIGTPEDYSISTKGLQLLINLLRKKQEALLTSLAASDEEPFDNETDVEVFTDDEVDT